MIWGAHQTPYLGEYPVEPFESWEKSWVASLLERLQKLKNYLNGSFEYRITRLVPWQRKWHWFKLFHVVPLKGRWHGKYGWFWFMDVYGCISLWYQWCQNVCIYTYIYIYNDTLYIYICTLCYIIFSIICTLHRVYIYIYIFTNHVSCQANISSLRPPQSVWNDRHAVVGVFLAKLG